MEINQRSDIGVAELLSLWQKFCMDVVNMVSYWCPKRNLEKNSSDPGPFQRKHIYEIQCKIYHKHLVLGQSSLGVKLKWSNLSILCVWYFVWYIDRYQVYSSLWVKWQNSKPIIDHQNQISELKKARMEGALRTAKVVENWRPLVLQIFSSNWAETDIEAKRAFQCMTNLHGCNFILCLYSGHFRFGSIFYNFLSFYCLFISIPNIAGGSFRIFRINHLFYKSFNNN